MAKPDPYDVARQLEDRAAKVGSRDTNTATYLKLGALEIRRLQNRTKQLEKELAHV